MLSLSLKRFEVVDLSGSLALCDVVVLLGSLDLSDVVELTKSLNLFLGSCSSSLIAFTNGILFVVVTGF